MTCPSPQALTISHAKGSDLEEVRALHRRAVEGKFIWPRTDAEFDRLVSDRHVFIIKTGEGTVVGLGYLRDDDERTEFGGVFLEDCVRGGEVSWAFAIVAICTHFLTEPERELIARVHKGNNKPRGGLERLGFAWTKEVEIKDAPLELERNKDGNVIGDEFRFQAAQLERFARWLEDFDGRVTKAGSEIELTIDADIWKGRAQFIPELLGLAKR